MSSVFLDACLGRPTPYTPIWLMRQAGRYLPEYRALRAKTDFLGLCADPALAAEVTLQPLRRFPLDAAILFTDLLVPLVPMGVGLRFGVGEGPIIEGGVSTPDDVDRLVVPDAEATLAPMAEAARRVVAALPKDVPLIGFAGAPFTLASYLIEGGSSRTFHKTKRFLYEHPEAGARLLDKLADLSIAVLKLQCDAGCRAVQIFDSWAGCLDEADYLRFGLAPTRRIVSALKAPERPVIAFAKGCGAYLDRVAETGADVLGVDWTLSLTRARALVGDGVTLQGNLDPARMTGPWSAIEPAAQAILDQAGPRHVFNLGHGLTPETPVENVARLVDLVHERSGRGLP